MATIVSYKWRGDVLKLKGRKVANKSALEIGLIIERQARELTPKDTGRLRASITTRSTKESSKAGPEALASDIIAAPTNDNEVFVGTAVDYAWWQEFGTQRMDAQPFLRPALDLARGKTLTIVEENGRYEFAEYMR